MFIHNLYYNILSHTFHIIQNKHVHLCLKGPCKIHITVKNQGVRQCAFFLYKYTDNSYFTFQFTISSEMQKQITQLKLGGVGV